MNTLNLGREVETLGLGPIYGGVVISVIRAVCRLQLVITREVRRVLTY